jgi:hypothetical protein
MIARLHPSRKNTPEGHAPPSGQKGSRFAHAPAPLHNQFFLRMESNDTADQPPLPASDGDAIPVAEAPTPVATPLAEDHIESETDDTALHAGEPEQTAEVASADSDRPGFNLEELCALAAQGGGRRLSPPDEEKAVRLVQAGLAGTKEDVARVAELLPQLGWSITVKGAANAWPTLKAASKTSLLKALGADDSEGGRRIRLSLARGLFKIPDLPACLKLTLGVCKEIRDKKTGEIPQKEASNFASVMIGKGKPWIAQLPLADLKPADAGLLVHCAAISAFAIPGPPVTPLGVLKWVADAGRIGGLHDAAIAFIAKHTSKWSAKWADVLRKELPGLPSPILASLKSQSAEGLPPEIAAEPGAPLPAEAPEPAPESASTNPQVPDGEGSSEAENPRPRQRPVYVSKTIPPKDAPSRPAESPRSQPLAPQGGPREAKPPATRSLSFNADDALRQLETHISWLKNELQGAEKKLRTRDDDRRQARRKPEQIVIEGDPTPDELARLNLQLENRIAELQARIDDLTVDAEARAVSQGAFGSGPQPGLDAQLRTLLGLKLAEAFADFSALEREDRDLVVPQHYRTVLREVFSVLQAENIPFTPTPPEA